MQSLLPTSASDVMMDEEQHYSPSRFTPTRNTPPPVSKYWTHHNHANTLPPQPYEDHHSISNLVQQQKGHKGHGECTIHRKTQIIISGFTNNHEHGNKNHWVSKTRGDIEIDRSIRSSVGGRHMIPGKIQHASMEDEEKRISVVLSG